MAKSINAPQPEDEALAQTAADYIAAVRLVTGVMPEVPENLRSCNLMAMGIQAVIRGYITGSEPDHQPEVPFAVGLAFGCLVGQLDGESRLFSIQSMLQGMNQGIESIRTISETVGAMQ